MRVWPAAAKADFCALKAGLDIRHALKQRLRLRAPADGISEEDRALADEVRAWKKGEFVAATCVAGSKFLLLIANQEWCSHLKVSSLHRFAVLTVDTRQGCWEFLAGCREPRHDELVPNAILTSSDCCWPARVCSRAEQDARGHARLWAAALFQAAPGR